MPGLEEAIVGMQAGGRRRILVPPSLGYDEALKVRLPTLLRVSALYAQLKMQ